MKRGVLVVVEGPDRAGKTTVAKRLAEECGFTYVKLPDRSTPTGQLIHAFIANGQNFSSDKDANERAAQYIFAANNMEKRAWLVEILAGGSDVVLDRYVDSACVYHEQAVGLQRDELMLALNGGMPAPDLVIVLDADFQTTSKREGFGGERNDIQQIQEGVMAGYKRRLGVGGCAPWPASFVDASSDKNAVFDVVRRLAVAAKESRCTHPLSFI
jgi:dTMP kinase